MLKRRFCNRRIVAGFMYNRVLMRTLIKDSKCRYLLVSFLFTKLVDSETICSTVPFNNLKNCFVSFLNNVWNLF